MRQTGFTPRQCCPKNYSTYSAHLSTKMHCGKSAHQVEWHLTVVLKLHIFRVMIRELKKRHFALYDAA